MFFLCCELRSSATLSAESEVEKKQVFDGDKAALLVRELRNNFDSGKTKSYEWRISQLEAIAKMLVEKENEIIDALHKDVSKPRLEAYITEVFNQFPLLFLYFEVSTTALQPELLQFTAT